MLHLVRNEPTCNFFTDLGNNREVVSCEVLVAFLVCDFEAADGVVAKLDRDEQNVFDHLVEPFIDLQVVSQFLFHLLTLHFPEVFGLPSVEHCAQHILGLTRELDRLPQSARYHFAKEVVFYPIV